MNRMTNPSFDISITLSKFQAECISNYCDKVIQELEDYIKDNKTHCVVWDMRLEEFKELKNKTTSYNKRDKN